MAPKCGVCVEAESKYKCPNCLTPYCSLACYKTHKVTPCTKPPDPSAASQNEDVAKQPPRSFEENEDESGWRLRRAQLEAMAASDDIRRMLRDDELRKLIQKIDSSITPEKDLDKAMEGAAFKQFTDKILAVVSSEDKSHVTQS
ncbi:zinc finger HIT domain-containing protein 3 [Marchantia polymorpha subsp. ruderalis]|uniref:HIT-type domain-containing protein n=2 Tax=Marchantia polymorpha TaxID=3197 RepID=A0AAF6C118_MARPO|nr:hypothetical protein MARPO_0102s0014 [Marchantia polymorpha]BBN17952.1 hypothetical protein Mp_7g18260 [Marchantia polymorpha subsp. ruderalis]|eukprot:PTQ32138.1 hypothetical protein MARPO_0102s0014 [Marchantia polymorpha]